jgi:hypothetical protein
LEIELRSAERDRKTGPRGSRLSLRSAGMTILIHFVALSRNFTSAARSAAAPMVCSGILVPGV